MKITQALIERNKKASEIRANYLRNTTKDRFWERVNVLPEKSKCWQWKPKGRFLKYKFTYPMMSCRAMGRRTPVVVHRVAYWLHTGDDPKTGHICHRCGNRLCCNPHHLYLGTAAENYADSVRHGTAKPPKSKHGEENPCSKLNDEKVRLIRNLWPIMKRGDKSSLAKILGVHPDIARRIANGEGWAHIN